MAYGSPVYYINVYQLSLEMELRMSDDGKIVEREYMIQNNGVRMHVDRKLSMYIVHIICSKPIDWIMDDYRTNQLKIKLTMATQ